MGRSIGTEAAAALLEFGAGRSTGWRRFGPVGVEYRLADGALLWRPISADGTTDPAYADDDGAGEVEFERIEEDGALEALACGLLLARNAEVGEEPLLAAASDDDATIAYGPECGSCGARSYRNASGYVRTIKHGTGCAMYAVGPAGINLNEGAFR